MQEGLDVQRPRPRRITPIQQSTIPQPTEWCFGREFSAPSDRRLGVRSEVVVERHLPVRNVVLLPAQRALSELELRGDELLQERIAVDVLLGDLVEQLVLPLQDHVRRLEEADLILRL